MKKSLFVLLVFYAGLVNLSVFGQFTTTTITSKPTLSTCQRDTFLFNVSNGGVAHTDYNLEVTVPPNFILEGYDSSVLTNGSLISGNRYGFDIINLANGANSFRIYTSVPCGANIAGDYKANITNASSVSMYRDTSNTNSVSVPFLIINGLENTLHNVNNTTYLNGSPIDLSLLKTGDTLVRRFRVKMTTINARVNSFTVVAPKFAFDILGVSSGANVTLNVSQDTAFYEFNTNLIGASLPGGGLDSLIFTDTIVIQTGCNPSSTSFNHQVSVGWGCGATFCDEQLTTVEGNMIPPSPSPAVAYATSGHISAFDNSVQAGYSFCEQNFVEFTINNTSVGNAIAGSMFDVDIQFGLRDGNGSSFEQNNVTFDSVILNGINVPMVAGNLPGRRRVGSLNTSNYTGGGLADLNNDGLLNDIQPGGSLTIRYYFKINALNNYDSCFDNVSNNFFSNRFWVEVPYTDICADGPTTVPSAYHNTGGGFGLQMVLQPTDDFLYITGVEDSLFSLQLLDEWRTRGTTGQRMQHNHMFIVPNYVKARNFSSSLSGASLIVIDNSPLEDTVIVMGNDNGFAENTMVDFAIVCALKTNPCDNQPFPVTGKSVLKFIDANGVVCDSICAQEKLAYVQDIACDSVISEMLMLDTIFERATFGWTDETMSTFATRTTPGVVLDVAHNFDSLRVYARAMAHNSITLDSLFFHMNYIQPFTDLSQFPNPGFEPVSLLNTYARIRIFDDGTSTDRTYIINDLAPYVDSFSSDTAVTGLTNYVFNFSNFIDSMRTTAAGPNFLIGGDLSSSVYSPDIVEIELFFYGNQMNEEFLVTPQLQISSQRIVNATAIPGFCLLPSTVSTIDVKAFVLSPYYFHGHLGDCAGTRTANGQGFSAPPPNYYFPEVRQIGVVDTMIIAWDGNYLAVLDSAVYFDESRSIFSFVGTDTLPKDPNRYYYSNDSLYIFPQDSTWQDFIDFSYGVNLQQTCQATNNSQIAVRMRISGTNYTEGIGGPYSFVSSTVDGATIDNGDPQTLSPINILPFLSDDTACWYFRMENLTSTDYSNFNWLNMYSSFGSFDVFKLEELDGSVPSSNVINTFNLYEHTPGYKFAMADDTLKALEIKYFRACAVIDTCIGDSLTVESGFNCAGWPDTATFTYPQTGYVCPDNVKTIKIFNDAPSARIEYLITNEPVGSVLPCDTLDYTILIRNVGLGDANNVFFTSISPNDTNNIYVIPGSSVLEFPSGTFNNLPNPTGTSFDSYTWDFSSVINGTNPLEQTGYPNDEAWISFKAVTGCPFTVGSQLRFQVAYLRDCGTWDTVNSLSSSPITITGVPSAPDKSMSIVNLDTNNGFCTGQEIDFGVLHQGGVNTSSNTILQIILDSNFNIYDPVSGFNTGVLSNTVPDSSYVENNERVIEYIFNNSFANGDSSRFTFILAEDSTLAGVSCGNTIPFRIRLIDRYITTCVATSENCAVYFEFDTAQGVFDFQKANYSITSLAANYTMCDDSINVSFNLDVLNEDVSSSYIQFNLIADLNANGSYDGGDVLIDLPYVFPSATLLAGTTTPFSHTFRQSDYLSSDVCQLLLIIDTNSSCACNNAQALTNVGYTGTSSGVVINTCTDSVILGGCVDAYLSKTFTWVDANGSGAESLLSTTNSDSTVFYPNTSVTTATTYTYYLEADRGGCVARDTIQVTVNPVATGIAYSNGSGTYELCSDSLSFTFNVDNTNPSTYGIGGTNVVEVYGDSNQNGVFDGADVLLSTSFSYDSIPGNSSLTFSATLSQFNDLGFDVCNLIVRSTSTVGCGNDSSALIVPIADVNSGQYFTVGDCADPITLTLCDSQYTARTYNWVSNGVNDGIPYLSSTSAQSVTFSPDRGMALGTYEFVVDVDKGSCIIQDTITIDVTASSGPCGLLVIPEFISPGNGDGLNDEWILNGIDTYPGNDVKVFNRWGTLVYSTTDYDNGNPFKGITENGSGKDGEVLPSGAYFYMVDLKDGYEPRTGFVHVDNQQ